VVPVRELVPVASVVAAVLEAGDELATSAEGARWVPADPAFFMAVPASTPGFLDISSPEGVMRAAH